LQQLMLTLFQGDSHVSTWASALCSCSELASIDLSHNCFSEVSMASLGLFLKQVTGLQELYLAGNLAYDTFLRTFCSDFGGRPPLACLRALDVRAHAGDHNHMYAPEGTLAKAAWDAFPGLAGAGAAKITYEGWLRKWVHAQCNAA
jgi:hypothetical protein